MKLKFLLMLLSLVILASVSVFAQTDLTHQLANPSFEDNVDAMAIGWDYEGGADVVVWNLINTDGDETKDGNNICGLWNPEFADEAITQTLTGLENGMYRVTADFTVGVTNATPGQRLTTQRIFANNSSVLYGDESAYSEGNIAVLTNDLGETITYAGHEVSIVENGPFLTCTVETEVSDGTLKLGVKTNGTLSQHAFSFPEADQSGWGWFKVDNFTLTLLEKTSVDENFANELKIGVNNRIISVEGAKTYEVYDIRGRKMPHNQQLENGLYLLKSNGMVKKVLVK
ncbi:hypothetical protein [Roseimarinus sediminis]|uniref:hypothetical protein n=1 Tax=Roseimarinus sediminis TaxID=1610899 RepID=UPI003D1FBA37